MRRDRSLVRQLGLNERTVSALYNAASDRLRRDAYHAEEGSSRDRAIRDIRRLHPAGVVESVGYGPTRHYFAAGELKTAATPIAVSLTAVA